MPPYFLQADPRRASIADVLPVPHVRPLPEERLLPRANLLRAPRRVQVRQFQRVLESQIHKFSDVFDKIELFNFC